MIPPAFPYVLAASVALVAVAAVLDFLKRRRASW